MINQKGIVHVLVVLILLLGIAAGLFLVKNPQIFKPKEPKANGNLTDREVLHSEKLGPFRIRPVILIPEHWKDKVSNDQIEDYKKTIVGALKEVQTWYAQKLDGHTFIINDQDFMVVTEGADTVIIPGEYEFSGSYFFKYLYNVGLFDDMKDELPVMWALGGEGSEWGGGGEFGFTGTKNGRYLMYGPSVWMNHPNLINLSNKSNPTRDISLSILAHELGHSFGLMGAGWASQHSCSETKPTNCLEGAPLPLPKDEDGYTSLMGGPWNGLSKLRLNDSIHNPEIWKIYQSPFINPTNDPVPAGTVVPSITVTDTNIPRIECEQYSQASLYLPYNDQDVLYYLIRVNNTSDGWDGSCRSDISDDFCFDRIPGSYPYYTSYPRYYFNITQGVNYELWYHKLYRNGDVSKESKGIPFSCSGYDIK